MKLTIEDKVAYLDNSDVGKEWVLTAALGLLVFVVWYGWEYVFETSELSKYLLIAGIVCKQYVI